MKAPLRVLHLEDNPTDAELIRQTLVEGGISCDVAMVDTREGFLAALQRGGFDIILADYRLPAFDGPSALKIAREKCPEVPFIMVSGILGEELAVETVKSGATDYVLKNRLSRLAPTVRRAIREAEDRMVRQRMGEALAESEQKYRALFEGSLEAMCLTKEGKIVDVNPAWLKLHGFQNRNEALGMDVLSVIHPDDRHILEERRANFQEGLTRIYQVRDVRKDGSILDVELYSSAIVIGGTTGILTTIRDVTTRKRAEQKVRFIRLMRRWTDVGNIS
jgi:PAS domain S-box-containing protein